MLFMHLGPPPYRRLPAAWAAIVNTWMSRVEAVLLLQNSHTAKPQQRLLHRYQIPAAERINGPLDVYRQRRPIALPLPQVGAAVYCERFNTGKRISLRID
ncbi:Uncharacterised protein [Mycobacteroides abscessus subsp. massiliense]|nr:Uncharacterised protein [Mycobacteroides abscessus subsp. abscessus]SKQ84744.1 Uncharacterised protein [Mycobacteroides abscessus subsp. massiliense]SLC49365.1 Uncharacterised protein [Mycobacteroides abscessus subsp. massiliense]